MTGKTAFYMLFIITVALAGATVTEKICGSAAAMTYVYHSPVTVALWCGTAVAGMWAVVRRRRRMPWSAFALHSALAVILAGAGVSYLTAEEGSVRLAEGEAATGCFTDREGNRVRMPFSISLISSEVRYHPGTSSAMDYVSEVKIGRNGTEEIRTVAMNRILTVDGYRFYQTGIGNGTSTLTVSHDPWGTGITYCGYALMMIAMTAFFFSRKSRFRALVRATATAALIAVPAEMCGAENISNDMPKTLQRPLARNFGQLYVMWNGRVAPVNTLAREFCLKIYGKESYRGLTADQVLTGWLFYYDDWKREPIIKIKGDKVKRLLGTESRYVALQDFYRGGRYLAEEYIADRDLLEADEKVALISQVCTGNVFRMFPYREEGGKTGWMSWAERFPAEMGADDRRFIANITQAVARDIAHGHFNRANEALGRIKAFQESAAGIENLPSPSRFRAELAYNRLNSPGRAAATALAAGLAAFALFCAGAAGKRCGRNIRRARAVITILTGMITLYLAAMMTLRAIAAGHLPLTNGHETMCAMALAALVLSLWLGRRLPVMLPGGLTVSGLALAVASMGESNPAVSPLMPVLSSPLLSIHVMLVMTAYALFAIMALNSVAALAVSRSGEAVKRLADVSRLLLYPAVFLLGAGIFTGAIWANQSWGRYWGWDPKETWALITFIVYATAIHTDTFRRLRRPAAMHIYLFAAFLAVVITYFGVNYFMTGLHSYAT